MYGRRYDQGSSGWMIGEDPIGSSASAHGRLTRALALDFTGRSWCSLGAFRLGSDRLASLSGEADRTPIEAITFPPRFGKFPHA
jgi:hypothetical protein